MSAARHIEFPVHTREEFYELERISMVRHEFYAGVIVPVFGSTPRHGRIVGGATAILGRALENGSCFAVPCCQIIRVEAADLDAYPDVVVYCEDAAFDTRFKSTLLEPLVLVEVLSPSTKNTDLTTKRTAYFQLPTLTDYLILWQDKIRCDQWVRGEDGAEPTLRRHLSRNSRVRLDALGIEFDLGACYRRFDELPEGIE